jgi:hypothetical protein
MGGEEKKLTKKVKNKIIRQNCCSFMSSLYLSDELGLEGLQLCIWKHTEYFTP